MNDIDQRAAEAINGAAAHWMRVGPLLLAACKAFQEAMDGTGRSDQSLYNFSPSLFAALQEQRRAITEAEATP